MASISETESEIIIKIPTQPDIRLEYVYNRDYIQMLGLTAAGNTASMPTINDSGASRLPKVSVGERPNSGTLVKEFEMNEQDIKSSINPNNGNGNESENIIYDNSVSGPYRYLVDYIFNPVTNAIEKLGSMITSSASGENIVPSTQPIEPIEPIDPFITLRIAKTSDEPLITLADRLVMMKQIDSAASITTIGNTGIDYLFLERLIKDLYIQINYLKKMDLMYKELRKEDIYYVLGRFLIVGELSKYKDIEPEETMWKLLTNICELEKEEMGLLLKLRFVSSMYNNLK